MAKGLGINERRAVGREEGREGGREEGRKGGVGDNFNDCRDNFLAVRRGENFESRY